MSSIRVLNKRGKGNCLFHYAHFICDCLIPEVIDEYYTYDTIYRIKNIKHTIGNFSKIYEEVMKNKNVEISLEEFQVLQHELKIPPIKKKFKKNDFEKFRSYIFDRYQIGKEEDNTKYPEILVIERGERKDLLGDSQLKDQLKNMIKRKPLAVQKLQTGKERREMDNIEYIKKHMEDHYGEKYKCLLLENIPFEEQIRYFYHAKYIVAAHGAALSNMIFCQKGCYILEVECNTKWEFFDKISKELNLFHFKVKKNRKENILQRFSEMYNHSLKEKEIIIKPRMKRRRKINRPIQRRRLFIKRKKNHQMKL